MDYQFDFAEQPRRIQMTLDSTLREEFRRAPHSFQYTGNRPPTGWREKYYAMFLNAPGDEGPVQLLLESLRQIAGTGEELAEAAIAFVQGSIAYDYATLHRLDQSTIRYPYETLFDQTGVCADKSMLLARLLRGLGYGTALFSFPRANHMAVGIRVPAGHGDFRTDFAFVETTRPTAIGSIPNNYAGGVRLERNPEVITVATGKEFGKIAQLKAQQKEWERQYGKEYLWMGPEMRRMREKMVGLEGELKELKQEMRGCRGNLPPDKYQRCQTLQTQHNNKVAEYNALVQQFNQLNQSQGATPL